MVQSASTHARTSADGVVVVCSRSSASVGIALISDFASSSASVAASSADLVASGSSGSARNSLVS